MNTKQQSTRIEQYPLKLKLHYTRSVHDPKVHHRAFNCHE